MQTVLDFLPVGCELASERPVLHYEAISDAKCHVRSLREKREVSRNAGQLSVALLITGCTCETLSPAGGRAVCAIIHI